jgi:PmbA protein
LSAEARGREADARISNSDGASVNTSESLATYANSHGFIGFERSTSHSISCSLIAGRDDGMRGTWYSTALTRKNWSRRRALAVRGQRTVAGLGRATGAPAVSSAVRTGDGAQPDRHLEAVSAAPCIGAQAS